MKHSARLKSKQIMLCGSEGELNFSDNGGSGPGSSGADYLKVEKIPQICVRNGVFISLLKFSNKGI